MFPNVFGNDSLYLLVSIMKESEEEIEELSDYWLKVGESSGLKTASNYLMKEALEYFAIGKDEYAREFRRLANEFEKQSEKTNLRRPET